MTTPFTTTELDDGVLSLRIATDDECHMDPQWSQRLVQSLDGIGHDAAVRVLLLEGGARIFCAGASREALLTRRERSASRSAASWATRAT